MPRYIPAPGRIVPDPENNNQPLPEGGKYLPYPLPQYWAKRLADGDILPLDEGLEQGIVVKPAVAAAPAPQEE